MSLLFNMLSRLVITFLPRSKCLLISWLQSPSAVTLETKKNKVSHCFHCSPIYLLWSDGSRCQLAKIQNRAQVSVCVCSTAQSCPTLCNPIDYSLPGSSVFGVFQARILEWVVISSSRGSSRPRDWTGISCTGRQFLYHGATPESVEQ